MPGLSGGRSPGTLNNKLAQKVEGEGNGPHNQKFHSGRKDFTLPSLLFQDGKPLPLRGKAIVFKLESCGLEAGQVYVLLFKQVPKKRGLPVGGLAPWAPPGDLVGLYGKPKWQKKRNYSSRGPFGIYSNAIE